MLLAVRRAVVSQAGAVRMFAAGRSLAEPLRGVDAPLPLVQGEVKSSALKNGIRVTSVDNSSPISRVVITVGSGSRDKWLTAAGAPHLLAKAAFLSTEENSFFVFTRLLDRTGSRVTAAAGRESLTYQIEALRSQLPAAFALVAQAVAQPTLASHELKVARSAALLDLAEFNASPGDRVLEKLHAQAFQDQGLGASVVACESAINSISAKDVSGFLKGAVSDGPVVIAGVNVDHKELVSLANEAFGDVSKTGNGPSRNASSYTGGSLRLHDSSMKGQAFVGLAYEGPSAKAANFADFAVLKALLGEAGDARCGYLGFSGAAKDIAAKFSSVSTASAFLSVYSDAGLIGVSFASNAAEAGPVLSAFKQQLEAISQGNVSAESLARAKRTVARQLNESLQSAAGIAAELSAAADLSGLKDKIAKVEAASATSVAKAAKQALSKPATVVALGDTSAITKL